MYISLDLKKHDNNKIVNLIIFIFLVTSSFSYASNSISLKCSHPKKNIKGAWHFNTGIPISEGKLNTDHGIKLYKKGKEIPVQWDVRATWGPAGSKSEKSVKWLGLNFTDPKLESGPLNYKVKLLKKKPKINDRVSVSEDQSSILIDNGVLKLTFKKPSSNNGFNLIDRVEYQNNPIIQSNQEQGAFIHDEFGNRYWACLDRSAKLKVEVQGPEFVVLKAEGWFVSKNPKAKTNKYVAETHKRPAKGFCRFITRISIAANMPGIKVQHTIIFTEDSHKVKYGSMGLELPLPENVSKTKIGIDEQSYSIENDFHLLQNASDQYEIQEKGKVIKKGKRSPGWVQTGNLLIAQRDFWQNFPSEIGVYPSKKKVRWLFWPEHGIKRQDQPSDIQDKDQYHLQFVHSGKILDFNVPEFFKNDKKKYRLFHKNYPVSAYHANALGVSKTHELWIDFSKQDQEQRKDLFLTNPHLMADPKYIEKTKVLYPLLSENKKDPHMEHFFNEGQKYLMRLLDKINVYGMWNFGDQNHSFYEEQNTKSIYPSIRRTWANTHHGYSRIPWILYMRNADPAHLNRGRRQNSHIIDIDVCHWSNLDMRLPKKIKFVGGICDYKGFVHWNAGYRNHYNSGIDFMLWDYYLTGNLRSLDVAMEHGYYNAAHLRGLDNREGAGKLNAIIDLYKATWDPKVKSAMHHVFNQITQKKVNQHSNIHWMPWLINYYNLTKSKKAEEYILYWADHANVFYIDMVAYAYRITGEKRFAKECARLLHLYKSYLPIRNDFYNGCFGRKPYKYVMDWKSALYAEDIARSYSLKMKDLIPEYWSRNSFSYDGLTGINTNLYLRRREVKGRPSIAEEWFGKAYPWPEGTYKQLEFHIKHDRKPKPTYLGCWQQRGQTIFDIYQPNGQLLKSIKKTGTFGSRPHKDKVKRRNGFKELCYNDKVLKGFKVKYPHMFYLPPGWEEIYQPNKLDLSKKDPTGFYKIIFKADNHHRLIPPVPPTGKLWIKIGKTSTFGIDGNMFFYVPKKVKEFELRFLPSYIPKHSGRTKLFMSSGFVYDPSLNPVGTIQCGRSLKPQVMKFKVKPKQQGKVWLISSKLVSLVAMKKIPPFISPCYNTFKGKVSFPKY